MEANPNESGERLLRIAEVEHRTGLKKSAIYDAVRHASFPAPIKLGCRASAWPESDVSAWIAEKIRDGRATCKAR